MADDIQSLTQFTLSEADNGYLIEIEGDGGGALSVRATPEQLDAIIEALDNLLSEDEGAIDEVQDDDAEGGIDAV